MDQTILVVEDDKMIRDLVRIYLEKAGYHVVEAADGEAAKAEFLTTYPCLVVLDLMLPKVSGEAFYEWITMQEHHDVSVVILSAKARIDDKVAGLRMGADSYITKPFDPNELVAQIEAVLRRTGQYCQKIVYDGLCIMPRKGEVLLDGEIIKLTKHEFNLLYHFMQHPNIVFSREQLVNEMYPMNEQDILERTIDAHIKKVREKIENRGTSPKRIQTVRGMGYKYVTK